MMNRGTRRLGVGLVSAGWMGRLHTAALTRVPLLYPELDVRPEFVIAADTDAAQRDHARDALGYAAVTADYREVVSHPDVDVVSICAPNHLHAEIAIAAAEKGKHIWIEKPAGRTSAETEAVAVAARRAGVTTAVGFNYRNAPAVEHARNLIARGELGRIVQIRGTMLADYSADPRGARTWRFVRSQAGSGVLGDLMGHLIDLVHYTVGPISHVDALTQIVHRERPRPTAGAASHFSVAPDDAPLERVENEDTASLLMELENGAIGTLEASRVAIGPRAHYTLEVYGTEGSLAWDFERMGELRIARAVAADTGFTTVLAGPAHGDLSRFQPGAGIAMGFDDLKVIEAAKFVRAIFDGGDTHASIEDALAAARVVTRAEESAAARRPHPTTHEETR